jgi:hypothetical protein
LRDSSLGKRAKRRKQNNNFHFILPKESSVRSVPPFCRRGSIHWGSKMTAGEVRARRFTPAGFSYIDPAGHARRLFAN